MMNMATNIEVAEPVTINDNFPILEWEGVRVVTTETLALGYGSDAANLRKNFERNAKRFVDGVHVFHLTGSKLRDFKNYATKCHVVGCSSTTMSSVVNKHAKHFTLWTEKGAARMSKIVDTDQAWEFFEKLENAYFRPRQVVHQESPIPASIEQLLNTQNQLMQQHFQLTKTLLNEVQENRQLRTELALAKAHQPLLTDQQLLRERDELAERLGRSRNYATIDAVERKLEREFGWHRLRNWCLRNNVEPLILRKFQCVNAWPRGAWLDVYQVDLEELFG